MAMFRIDGSRALVTGGSSGIGRAVAIDLARRGAHVALLARGHERLAEAERAVLRVARPGRVVATVIADVTCAEDVARAREEARQALGGVDLLVNSAGAARPATVVDTDLETFRSLMDVNCFGTVQMTKALLPDLIAQRHGHVVGIASVVGFLGFYGYGAYAASKFAVAGFFECLRQELLPHGVGTTVAFPGDTDTPQLVEENLTKPSATRAIAGKVPVLSAETVARAIVDGVVRRRLHVVPGSHARATQIAARHAPWLVRWVMDRELRRHVAEG